MKQLIIAIISVLVLSACGSKTVKPTTNQIQQFGAVTVKFDSDGKWEEISSDAVVAFRSEDPRDVDSARRMAGAEAKRNIATFLNTNINFNSVTKTSHSGDSHTSSHSDTVTEYGSALLKGLVYDSQTVEGDRVRVHAVIRKQYTNATRIIREDMMR